MAAGWTGDDFFPKIVSYQSPISTYFDFPASAGTESAL
jgi:hypothetical protein